MHREGLLLFNEPKTCHVTLLLILTLSGRVISYTIASYYRGVFSVYICDTLNENCQLQSCCYCCIILAVWQLYCISPGPFTSSNIPEVRRMMLDWFLFISLRQLWLIDLSTGPSLSFSDRYFWIFPWKSQSFCQIIIRILHGRISITVLASINNVSYYEVCHGQTAQTNNNSGESESHGLCIVTPLRLIRKWQFA